MKKIYRKPLILVEELTLDQPIAANCKADKAILESMVQAGYFMSDDTTCKPNPLWTGPNGVGLWEDSNGNGRVDYGDSEQSIYDSLCYHSSIITAFYS